MWVVNYIKCVSVGGSHIDVTIKCGSTMRIENKDYEIKLHGGQDDVHEEIYHWYALYYGLVQFFVGLSTAKRSIDRLGIKLNDLDLSTHSFVDIFLNSCFSKLAL